jgi:hypothetical protein
MFVFSLTQGTVGLVIPVSSFLVPQLMSGDEELLITEDEGSWFGKFFKEKIVPLLW